MLGFEFWVEGPVYGIYLLVFQQEGVSNVEDEQGGTSSVPEQDYVVHSVGEGGSNVEEEEGGGSSVPEQDAILGLPPILKQPEGWM